MDLNRVLLILSLDRRQQRLKPLQAAEVSTHPEEVHLFQPSLVRRRGTHAVPDRLQYRCKWRHTNTSAHEQCGFEFENVFRCRPERPIEVYSWKQLLQAVIPTFGGWCHGDDFTPLLLLTLRLHASKGFAKGLGEVADHSDMY